MSAVPVSESRTVDMIAIATDGVVAVRRRSNLLSHALEFGAGSKARADLWPVLWRAGIHRFAHDRCRDEGKTLPPVIPNSGTAEYKTTVAWNGQGKPIASSGTVSLLAGSMRWWPNQECSGRGTG